MNKKTGFWLLASLPAIFPQAAFSQSIEELRDMPISALASLDVTSVTKSSGSLGDTPASPRSDKHHRLVSDVG